MTVLERSIEAKKANLCVVKPYYEPNIRWGVLAKWNNNQRRVKGIAGHLQRLAQNLVPIRG